MAAVGVHHPKEDAEFDFVLAHLPGQPVLAFFWGVWSAPCKTLEPVVRDLARAYAGRVAVVRTDIVRCPETVKRMAVLGAPTFVLLKDGTEVARTTEAVDEAGVRAFLDGAL
ncbi:thioredoxin family protein [Streptomyces bambusae]|uniref:thioredoxin family protein n=1 Tax=Streptomyces bambusae TaxID=1550616 RepID=UPI001CFDE277|nr:thioredoxin family protein [Streptomyces bambusae]MCB5166123.1 thioredoxin family protein [Streptomyces bambusae]